MEMKEVGIYRSYAGVFSCAAFSHILETNDLSSLSDRFHKFDNNRPISTYMEYIKYMYSNLCRFYRCEYIYKNAIINHILKEHKKSDNVVAINEFKVANSIADIAMFNGESIAFEIKTVFDSDRRVLSQLKSYESIFDKTYIVTDESCIDKYAKLNSKVGLYLLSVRGRGVNITLEREASQSNVFDVDILMRALNTNEYKAIISAIYGGLPDVTSFKMYRECLALIKTLPKEKIRTMAISQFKNRKKNSKLYNHDISPLRHICAGLDLDKKRYDNLIELLTKNLI